VLSGVATDIRRIQQADLPSAIALVEREVASNEWLGRIPELLDQAANGNGRETRACCVWDDAKIVGIGVYGSIAGTVGTTAIDAILVAQQARGRGLGPAIARFIRDELRASGAQLIVAELPDDRRVSEYRAVLWGIGFKEESRIADYYRDGTSLLQMRLEL
jgi:ribosomal protein S18 acetylase RimI-like enzyme